MNLYETFKYGLPGGKSLDIEIDFRKLLTNDLHQKSVELLSVYEKDYLFIPKEIKNVMSFLRDKYDFEKVDNSLLRRRGLEKDIFGYIDAILNDVSFDCSKEQAIDFFRGIVEDEQKALVSLDLDPTLELIVNSENCELHLRRIILQFAIEFLSEGSAITQFAGGSFGSLQSSMFRILIDEMGGGISEKKHSRLYEGTMKSLGYSSECGYYTAYFDTSMLHVTNYIYYLSINKKFFFRFIGALFRNETCFINWQKQLGEVARSVFKDKADNRYFDVHAVVDQDHATWSLDTIIVPAIEIYGEEIISEIIRGYIEYTLYQDINSYEFCSLLRDYDQLKKVNHLDGGNFQKLGNLDRFVTDCSTNITAKCLSDDVFLAYDGSRIIPTGEKIDIPAFFPILNKQRQCHEK